MTTDTYDAAIDAPAPDDASFARRNKIVINTLLVSTFVVMLNETAMSVALPPLMEAFNAPATDVQWLTTAFLLTMAVVIPVTGFLLQVLNSRPIFILAMSLFTAGTLVAALAPSLGILTINALTAADSVLIPLQCEYFALEGLTQLLRIINLVRSKLNTSLQIEGVLLTMFDARTRLASQVVQDVREHFKKQVYDVIIPRNVKLSEAPSFGQPISVYDPQSTGAIAYKTLAKDLLSRQKVVA